MQAANSIASPDDKLFHFALMFRLNEVVSN